LLLRPEACDRVVGTAQLEGADRLQALRLQEVSGLGLAERDERRPDRDAGEGLGGGADGVDADEDFGLAVLAPGPDRSLRAPVPGPISRAQSMQCSAQGRA